MAQAATGCCVGSTASAVNIGYFESVELYDAWIAGDLFTDHLSRIKRLVEKVEPALFYVAYEIA